MRDLSPKYSGEPLYLRVGVLRALIVNSLFLWRHCIEQGLGPRLDQSCHDSIGMDIEAIGLYGGEDHFANLVRIGARGRFKQISRFSDRR